MLKKILLAFGLSLIASNAWAACGAIPLTVKDAANATQNISSATAADGNCKTYIDADTASQIHSDLTASVPAGNNLIGKVGIDQTTPGTTNGVFVTNTLTAGNTNADGVATGTANVSPVQGYGFLFNGTTWDRARSGGVTGMAGVSLQASPSGGCTAYTPFVPAASDNHQTVKNGAGTACWIAVSNNSATKNYARLYDAGTGFNGCNSATGVIFAFEIPPTDSGFTIPLGGVNGLAFSTGLSLCITSGFGLTDTTSATATAMYVNVAYK